MKTSQGKHRGQGVVTAELTGLTHPLAVQVVHGLGDGEEHSAGLPLREEFLPQDPVQQLPSLHQLRHQVDESAIVIHLGRGVTVLSPRTR